jgi:hypothetical protein
MASFALEKWVLPAQPDKYIDTRYVNLTGDPDDYHVVLLASMGFTYDVISKQTGLSKGQIAYRLKQANQSLKPRDRISAQNYRNGRSETSKAVITLASKKVASIINPILRETQAIDV